MMAAAGWGPSGASRQARYFTGIAVAMVSVLMFFMALVSAYVVRKGANDWVDVSFPAMLWFNTVCFEQRDTGIGPQASDEVRSFWISRAGGRLLPRSAWFSWSGSFLSGANCSLRACSWPPIRPAVFSMFLLARTRCTLWAASALLYSSRSATLISPKFLAPPPRKSPRISGIFSMACGFFWRFCFTSAADVFFFRRR